MAKFHEVLKEYQTAVLKKAVLDNVVNYLSRFVASGNTIIAVDTGEGYTTSSAPTMRDSTGAVVPIGIINEILGELETKLIDPVNELLDNLGDKETDKNVIVSSPKDAEKSKDRPKRIRRPI